MYRSHSCWQRRKEKDTIVRYYIYWSICNFWCNEWTNVYFNTPTYWTNTSTYLYHHVIISRTKMKLKKSATTYTRPHFLFNFIGIFYKLSTIPGCSQLKLLRLEIVTNCLFPFEHVLFFWRVSFWNENGLR